MPRPIVLFIAGVGRSGSTLLGDVLDTFDGVTAVGELHHIWGRGADENWRCGDGPLFWDHPVWQRVVAAVEASEPGTTLRERATRADNLRKDRRKLVRKAPDGISGAALAYRAEFEVIFQTLADATNAKVIVDTGKVPFHAAMMQPATGIDFRMLHLVRDPCAVAFARSRTKPTIGRSGQVRQMRRFSPLMTALRWARRQHEVQTLSAHGEFATLSYEAFCKSPAHSLRAVRDALDLPIKDTDLDRLMSAQFIRRPGLAFSSNPNRLSASMTRITSDDRWRANMPWYNKALVRAVSGAGT
jgi:hypothetical protein